MRAIKQITNNQNLPIYSGNRAKTASSMMATPKQQKAPASSTSKNIDTARIDRLFGRFGAIYGHIWQSQFKSNDFLKLAKKEWGETLHGISDRNLNLTIEECKKRFEMPPTLPMFYQICRYFQGPKIESELEQMERKLRDAEHACAHWKKIILVAQEKGQQQIATNLQKVLEEATQQHITIKNTLEKRYPI